MPGRSKQRDGAPANNRGRRDLRADVVNTRFCRSHVLKKTMDEQLVNILEREAEEVEEGKKREEEKVDAYRELSIR